MSDDLNNLSSDAAAWSQALLASLVAAPQPQGPPPPGSSSNDFNLLQALLVASQANAGQASSNSSDSAAALLLASQLQHRASSHVTLSPTTQDNPGGSHYGSPHINRPRKSKKFRYSAVLKQIRQAEVGSGSTARHPTTMFPPQADGNPIRIDRLGASPSLPILPIESTQPMHQLPHSCGDAQCQQQLVALQTQLSYYRLEVDTLREALKALLDARKDAPADTSTSLELPAGRGASNEQEGVHGQ